jgi:hypothetical protein
MRYFPHGFGAMLVAGLLASGSAVAAPATCRDNAKAVSPLVCASDATAIEDLHPGDSVYFPGGFSCTLNFLWRGSDGHRYMGSAGHCALGTRVGEAVETSEGEPIGRLAYSVYDEGRRGGEDFALIRLAPTVRASSVVRHWGGPVGIYSSTTDAAQSLLMFGQAVGLSAAAPHREIYATAVTQEKRIRIVGPAGFSDSGAPIITRSGLAVGWFTTFSDFAIPFDISPSGGAELGPLYLTRLRPMAAMAEQHLRVRLTLQQGSLRRV